MLPEQSMPYYFWYDFICTEPGEDDDEDDDKEAEEQLEKQMGDVDQPYSDKLDEKMWGDEEDEDGEEEENQKEKREEFGEGHEEESESQLVAKDDNQGKKGIATNCKLLIEILHLD